MIHNKRFYWLVFCLLITLFCGAQKAKGVDNSSPSDETMDQLYDFAYSNKGLSGFYELDVSDQELLDMYTPSAEKGNPEAMVAVGTFYSIGRQIPQDIEKAAMWFKRAAELDYDPAYLMLINLYINGEYSDFDYDKAIKVIK